MQRSQTPTQEPAEQPPAEGEEQPQPAAEETGEPAAEGDNAEPPAETMVRQVATAVFNELFKPFEAKLAEADARTAKIERSVGELTTTVSSQATEMKRAFEGFRPGGQAREELGEPPAAGETPALASNLDWNWN